LGDKFGLLIVDGEALDIARLRVGERIRSNVSDSRKQRSR
jgi:hypothetical protein